MQYTGGSLQNQVKKRRIVRPGRISARGEARPADHFSEPYFSVTKEIRSSFSFTGSKDFSRAVLSFDWEVFRSIRVCRRVTLALFSWEHRDGHVQPMSSPGVASVFIFFETKSGEDLEKLSSDGILRGF